MIKQIGQALASYLAEGSFPWIWSGKIQSRLTRGPIKGYEKRPGFGVLNQYNTPIAFPTINKLTTVEAKIELHQARRAGTHLDFRIRVGNHIYDYAIVKRDKFPSKTGEVFQVKRTPNHSLRYFYLDRAEFGPGYGEGTMETAWRGGIDIISSDASRIEFNIPQGQFKGRYCIRDLTKGTVLLRMKEPVPRWKDRMQFDGNSKKLEKIYQESNIIAEDKIDGANYMIIPGEKENMVISRRLSVTGKPINKAENIPALKYHKFPKDVHGKTIHAEIVANNGSSSHTAGLLNSLPERSREFQSKTGKSLVAYFWDIEMDKPYEERRAYLKELVKNSPRVSWSQNNRFRLLLNRLFAPKLVQVPVSNKETKESPKEFAERLKSEGKEGAVIKHTDGKYYEDVWSKDKKIGTHDMKVIGFQIGTGKYSNSLGALIVEDPKTGAVSKVGGGFSDMQRDWIFKNQNLVKDKIIQAACLELTEHGVMRAPRFISFHPEAGIEIQDETGLKEYAEVVGANIYQLKSARGWRK